MLDLFEWHDLPVEEITLGASALKLLVSPFNEDTGVYDSYLLELEGQFNYSITSSFSSASPKQLELATLDYQAPDSQRITGSIGLLLGNDGYWEIRFSDAKWKLTKSA